MPAPKSLLKIKEYVFFNASTYFIMALRPVLDYVWFGLYT